MGGKEGVPFHKSDSPEVLKQVHCLIVHVNWFSIPGATLIIL